MVTLHYFAFGGEPVFGLTTCAGFAPLVEFVSATPNFFIEVDGNDILARFWLSDFELSWFQLDFVFRLDVGGDRFGCHRIHFRNADRRADNGLVFTSTSISTRTIRFA